MCLLYHECKLGRQDLRCLGMGQVIHGQSRTKPQLFLCGASAMVDAAPVILDTLGMMNLALEWATSQLLSQRHW